MCGVEAAGPVDVDPDGVKTLMAAIAAGGHPRVVRCRNNRDRLDSRFLLRLVVLFMGESGPGLPTSCS